MLTIQQKVEKPNSAINIDKLKQKLYSNPMLFRPCPLHFITCLLGIYGETPYNR